jgi:hypothetical protein
MAWRTAVAAEQSARRDLLKDQRSGEACRAWWGSVETLLMLYERNALQGRESNTPLPTELISDLKALAGFLAVGKIPKLVGTASKSKGGRQNLNPIEKEGVALAVLYVAAAQEGVLRNGRLMKIDDSSPIKTVADAYRVKRRTVQTWCEKYGADYIFEGHVDSTSLKELMLIAGERHQGIGRSEAAIKLRDNKRRARN